MKTHFKKFVLCKQITSIFLFYLFTTSALNAQNTVSQNNGWYMFFGNHRLSDKIGLHTEYQWRRSNWISNWSQSLMRFGLDWHLNKNLMLTGGYGWIKSYPYGKQPIAHTFDEHRIWQQVILQQSSGRLYFHHRYRLEQRFLENILTDQQGTPIEDGYRFRNRARYRLYLTIPINRKVLKDNTLFAGIYDEVFLGFGKGIGKNILDQNRLYFALGWRFNQNYNLQLGYLNHYIIKADGVHHENNHTLQVAFTYNLDFRTKEY